MMLLSSRASVNASGDACTDDEQCEFACWYVCYHQLSCDGACIEVTDAECDREIGQSSGHCFCGYSCSF
jgi:hypothetical protein